MQLVYSDTDFNYSRAINDYGDLCFEASLRGLPYYDPDSNPQTPNPYGVNGNQLVVSEAPDADELLKLASARGYLMWLFRPVSGGIWGDVTEDATLSPEGRRAGPCPLHPIPARCEGRRHTVYRFGVSGPRAGSPKISA